LGLAVFLLKMVESIVNFFNSSLDGMDCQHSTQVE